MGTETPEESDRALVDDLLALDSGLSDWEVHFAEDLYRWLNRNDILTDRQRVKANQILEKLEK